MLYSSNRRAADSRSARCSGLCGAFIWLVLTSAVFHPGAGFAALSLTLEQAWRQAERVNPALLSAQAQLDAARGELKDAQAPLWNNPELSGNVGLRSSAAGDGSSDNAEGGIGLTQVFETGGQQGARRSAAGENLAAVRENIDEVRRQVRAEVENRFFQVLSLQAGIEAEQATLQLVEQAARAIKRRVDAGEDSRLDGNLARVEAERAQNAVAQLSEQLIQARAELATSLQLPPDAFPEVSGTLTAPLAGYSLDDLLQSAAARPVVRVLEHQEAAARSRLQLERAAVSPDITLGISQQRESGFDTDDDITSLSIAVPLPLFRRNDTGIGRAFTALTQAQIDRQAGERSAAAQVTSLWEQVQSLRTRLARLEEAVAPALEENLTLSTESYQAGEIGITQLLLVNRQALDARRDVLAARTSLRLTTAALEAAAGWTAQESAQ